MKFYSVDRKLNKFNDFIRGEMRRQKLNQKDVAYRLGIDQPCLARRLSGQVNWTMREAVMLSEILNFSLGDWE